MVTVAVAMAVTVTVTVMVVQTGSLRAHRLAALAVVGLGGRSFGGGALHVVQLVIQLRLAQVLGGHRDLGGGRGNGLVGVLQLRWCRSRSSMRWHRQKGTRLAHPHGVGVLRQIAGGTTRATSCPARNRSTQVQAVK